MARRCGCSWTICNAFQSCRSSAAGRRANGRCGSEDVVDGLARLADQPIAFGKLYNFSGAESICMRDFANLLLEHRATRRPFLHLPVGLCRAGARLLALVMKEPPLTLNAIAGVIYDADLDPSEAMRDLGYRPIGVREGFARCFPLPDARGHAAVHSSEAL